MWSLRQETLLEVKRNILLLQRDPIHPGNKTMWTEQQNFKIYKVNGEMKPIVVGYLSILFSISDRINKQKNLVRIEDLNNTVIRYDLFDIYRANTQ